MERIVFFTGAGAVENAWQPILTALEKDVGFEIDADGANCFLASLVYLLRFYSTGTFPDVDKHSKIFFEGVNKVKSKISEALLFAENNKQIRAQKELKDILFKFIFSTDNQATFVTTNWDTVINNAINEYRKSNYPKDDINIQFIHLHGCVKSPKSLYLPSEVVREPYRSFNDDEEMGRLHLEVSRAIELSNKTILYGLSLDPLDAELSITLEAGWSSPNLREIILINPDHKKISQRVKLLLDSKYPAKIIGYSPSNLEDKYEY